MDARNILSDLPDTISGEVIEELVSGDSVRIERIVSCGCSSPEGFWYDQEENEWVMVLKGSAALRFEGEDELVVLRTGNWLNIPSHVRHRVEWTDPVQKTVWLAVFY